MPSKKKKNENVYITYFTTSLVNHLKVTGAAVEGDDFVFAKDFFVITVVAYAIRTLEGTPAQEGILLLGEVEIPRHDCPGKRA